MSDPLIKDNKDFVLFGKQHIWVLVITVAASILLPIISQQFLSDLQKLWLNRVFAIMLSAIVIVWIALKTRFSKFDKSTDLPLDFCNLMALFAPLLLWNPSKGFHEIMYFWILAGTFQAILTPYLFEGFPHFTFLKYWFVHAGLVVYIIFVTVAFKLFPDTGSIWRAFGWMQIYTVCMFGLNRLLGSNYFYIQRKPPTASILDYFGPWPWYLLVCEAIALVLYFLAYLPVYFWSS